MTHKLLIIDDNHSFVDTLQVTLRAMPLQCESTFRYNEAEKIIQECGSRIRQSEYQKLTTYISSLDSVQKQKDNGKTKADNTDEPELLLEKPILHQHPLNEAGLSLIIVEQDTETGRKGLDFIQSILRSNPDFLPSDFWILTSRLSFIQERVAQMGVTAFEKPIKNNQIIPLIQNKLESLNQQAAQAEAIIQGHEIVIGTDALTAKKAKSVQKKAPSAKTQDLTESEKPTKKRVKPVSAKKSNKAK